jgi:hypothetical protein
MAPRTATPEELVEEVRAAYRRGAVRVGLSLDNVASLLALAPLGPLGGLLTPLVASQAQQDLEKQLRQLAQDIAKWSGKYLSWARAGRREDGSTYSWALWQSYKDTYLSPFLERLLQETVSSSVVLRFAAEVVGETATEALDVAATVAQPWKWPTWAKVAVPAVGLLVALAIVAPYVTPLLPRRR